MTTRPMPKPIGRPLTGPVNRSLDPAGTSPKVSSSDPAAVLPDRERARNHALQTAAKIDQIEAEMARDLLGHSSHGPATTTPRSMTVAAAGPSTAAPQTTAKMPPAKADPIEENSELFGGNIDAIEINTSIGSSVVDEVAILFANGEIESAESLLRTGLRRDDLGSATRRAWHMLFELINLRGDRAAFERLTMDYALRFEHTPPAWVESATEPAIGQTSATAAPAPPFGDACVRLPEAVDAGIVGHLEKLRGLTAAHASVQLDASAVKRVDIDGATLLLRVIGAFKRSQHELTLIGAAEFAAVLARMVESGRRDPSDDLWILLLEVLRMLDRNEEFEEAAIQYCITFEVSPPSWEPPLPNLKVAPASSVAAGADAPRTESLFSLRGTVDGDGEPQFARIVAAARKQPEVIIDCGQLGRLSYSAGSALISTLRRIKQGGSSVELHKVSALVAALLHLLGVEAIASVKSRYR